MSNAAEPAARLVQLSYCYPGSRDRTPALQDVSLTIEPDDYVAVVGPNGSGKSTLLKILLGLLRPTAGTVRVFGSEPAEMRRWIGYVPQHASIDLDFPADAMDVVLMGRLGGAPWAWRYSEEDREAAAAALRRVDAADLAHRRLSELSGGQRQRVLIARALAADAKMLLLDEPTASVDRRMERSIYDLLHELNARIPIVLVTHDVGFITAHVKHVACLNRRLVAHTTGEVSDEVIAKMYEQLGPVHHLHHHHDGHEDGGTVGL